MLQKASEKEQEDRAWQQWLTLYPHMTIPSPHTKGNKPIMTFNPFSEFYRKITAKVSERPAEEILEEAREIRRAVKGR